MAGNPVSGHTASNHTADSGAVIGATAPDGLRDGDHILSSTLTNFVESHHGNGILLLEDGAYGSTRNDPDSLPGAVDVHQSTNSNYTLTVKGGHAILDGVLYSFANGYSGASPSSMSIVLGDADYTPGGSVSGTALSSGQEVLYTIFLTSDGGTHGGNSALHVRYEQGTPITTATNAYPNSPTGHLTEPDSSLSNKQSVVLASVRAIYQASSGGSHNIKITEINDKRVFIRPSVPQLFAPMTGGTVANTASGNAIDSANDLDGLHGTGTQSGDLVASDLGALWMSHSTATATDQMLYFSAKQGGTRSTFRIAPNKVESSSPSSNETFTFDDSNYFILTPSAAVDLNPSGTFPPGHTVLVSNRSSSYAVDFDKPEAATATITVSNTDVANIGSGDTIELISADGTTVTLTMQGTGGSTTSGSTSGATLTAKTLASGSYANPALHATAQAVEIRTAINHHTEFTATNSSNVITITQVNGGTAGNTAITITEIGATGLSKTDFSGGTRVNATSTITISNTDVANIGSGDTIVLISTDGTTVTLTMQGTGGTTTSSSTSGATLTSKTLSSGSYASASLHATAQAVEIRTAINHHTKFSATNSSNVITVTQAVGGADGNTTLTITELGATGMSNTNFTGGSGLADTVSALESCLFVYDGSAWQRAMVSSATPTPVSSGATGLVQLSDGSGGFTSDSKLYWTSGSSTFTVNGKLTVTGLIDPTGLVIDEKANIGATGHTTVGGKGLLWVKSDAPNSLMFTDDAGTDVTIVSGGAPAIDINGLTGAAIASGDQIAFSDEGESGDPTRKESIDDVATLFAGAGLTASSAVMAVGAGNLIDVQANQVDVDLTEAAAATIAAGDNVIFLDGGASGTQSKGSVNDIATLFAGTASSTGLSASSGVMSVSDLHPVGVDGAANQLLTDDGDGTVTSESKLTFDGKSMVVNTDTSGDSAEDLVGLHVDFDRTVASSGTNAHNDIGINLDVNSASLGTSSVIGMDIDVVGAASGTSTATGLTVDVGSADTNYAALFNGGNVGIGEAAPLAQLHITESSVSNYDPDDYVNLIIEDDDARMQIVSNDGGNNGTNIIMTNIDGSTHHNWAIGTATSAQDNILHIGYNTATGDAGAYTDSDFAITKTGNVGIGTRSPNQPLTIEGTMSMKEQAAANADTAAYGQLWVKTATPNELYFTTDAGNDIQLTSGTSIAGGGGASALNDLSDVSYSSGDLTITSLDTVTFANGGAALLTVANTAANTAGKNLTVSAGSEPGGGSNNADGGDLILASGGGDGTGTSSIQFKTKVSGTDAAAERMRIHTDGNVGIGSSTPYGLLHVKSNAEATLAELAEGGSVVPQVLIEGGGSTEGDNSPLLVLHNSSTAADDDYIGRIAFTGGDSGDSSPANPSEGTEYASISAQITDETDSTTDGELHFYTESNNNPALALTVSSSNLVAAGNISIGAAKTITAAGDGAGNPATITTGNEGLKIGTAASQKIGFFDVTPVVQQNHIPDVAGDPSSTVNAILVVLETFGLVASS